MLGLHKNNDGMSLIELIISMAITAIVLSMLMLLISTAANSFRRTNENVNLQLEAQVAINQISNLAMEASKIELSTNATAPDVKYLLKAFDDSNSYAIYYIAAKKKLYLIQSTPVLDADLVNPIATIDEEYSFLMAEYVDSISIDTTSVKTAVIKLDFALGNTQYAISKKVKLRNAK